MIDRLGLPGGGAAVQHLHAGEQFGKRIGLGQIVVAAGAQAGHAVVHLAQRRQDQHGRRVATRAQARDDGQAVAARQHPVDHHHIVVAGIGEREPAVAVARDMRGMTSFGERLLEIVGGLAIVFYDENLHGVSIREKAGEGL
jgi:hypothetical protein